MTILWLCNTMISTIAKSLGHTIYDKEGWVNGSAAQILENPSHQLVMVFPNYDIDKISKGKVDNLIYYMFPKDKKMCLKYEEKVENYLDTIISEVQPDVIHIFGTEMPHALSMIKMVKDKKIVVFSIQGMVSMIAKHYYADLPNRVIYSFSLRDLLRRDNIYLQRKKYENRGKLEFESLKLATHVIGRTDWDLACTKRINPNINYHFCNESLREVFYTGKWRYDKCDKYSIFIGQGSYPIKGLHYMLQAFEEILYKFSDSHLYIAGHDFLKFHNLKEKYGRSTYANYIEKLIKRMNLENRITFTGPLNEQEMHARLLKSNVFVSASSIENSSNSVGEAMILGVPVVASDVGGIKNIFTHNKDGFIYQHDAPYMLAYYIKEIFSDPIKSTVFSENARNHASRTHDKSKNCSDLLQIYENIANKE